MKRKPAGQLLAVDTSSDILGVGVLPELDPPIIDPESPEIMTMELDLGLHHVEEVATTVNHLLEIVGLSPDDLTGLIAAKGPGSFTGLRIGASILKGISAVTDAPITLVPTLEAHALPYRNSPGLVCALVDARKSRFYVQFFRGGEYLTPALDLPADKILERAATLRRPEEQLLLIGPDASKLGEPTSGSRLDQSVGSEIGPVTVTPIRRRSAVRGLLMAGAAQLEHGEVLPDKGGPLYLRGSEAVFPRKRG